MVRFQFKYVLLTYSQCAGLDPFEVVDHIASLNGECIVAREDHADGGIHLHVFAEFRPKFRSSRPTVFDVGGFHPNITPSRGNPWTGYDYATKDGDIVAGGLERPLQGESNDGKTSHWAEIVLATSREEFFHNIEKLDPRALCLSFVSLSKYADWRYRPEPERYVHPTNIHFSPERTREITEWYMENVEHHPAGRKLSFYLTMQ